MRPVGLHTRRGTSTLSVSEVRHALSHFASGVTVVTTVSADGDSIGTTASAFSSLSLDPPLLLVCLDRSSVTLAALRECGAFAINVLAEGQEELSTNFARRGADSSWDGVSHRRGESGSPHLDDALAVLDCDLERCVEGGDHEIVIGRLRDLACAESDMLPLLHYRGIYHGLHSR